MRSADGGHNYRLVIGLKSVFFLDLGKRADKRGTCVNVPEQIVLGASVTYHLLDYLAGTHQSLLLGSDRLQSDALALAVEMNYGTDFKHLTHKRLSALESAVVDKVIQLSVDAEELLGLHHPGYFLENILRGHSLVYHFLRLYCKHTLAEAGYLGVDDVDLYLILIILCYEADLVVGAAEECRDSEGDNLVVALLDSLVEVGADFRVGGDSGLGKIVLRVLEGFELLVKLYRVEIKTFKIGG